MKISVILCMTQIWMMHGRQRIWQTLVWNCTFGLFYLIYLIVLAYLNWSIIHILHCVRNTPLCFKSTKELTFQHIMLCHVIVATSFHFHLTLFLFDMSFRNMDHVWYMVLQQSMHRLVPAPHDQHLPMCLMLHHPAPISMEGLLHLCLRYLLNSMFVMTMVLLQSAKMQMEKYILHLNHMP